MSSTPICTDVYVRVCHVIGNRGRIINVHNGRDTTATERKKPCVKRLDSFPEVDHVSDKQERREGSEGKRRP